MSPRHAKRLTIASESVGDAVNALLNSENHTSFSEPGRHTCFWRRHVEAVCSTGHLSSYSRRSTAGFQQVNQRALYQEGLCSAVLGSYLSPNESSEKD